MVEQQQQEQPSQEQNTTPTTTTVEDSPPEPEQVPGSEEVMEEIERSEYKDEYLSFSLLLFSLTFINRCWFFRFFPSFSINNNNNNEWTTTTMTIKAMTEVMLNIDAVEILSETLIFASEKFIERTQKTEQDFVQSRPSKVSDIITEIGSFLDLKLIQAAVLCNVLKNPSVTGEMLQKKFGTTVRGIVEEISYDGDVSTVTKVERKKWYLERAENLSREAKIIQLANVIYKLQYQIDKSSSSSSSSSKWNDDIAVRSYCAWLYLYAEKLRGTDDNLEKYLDGLFSSELLSGLILPSRDPTELNRLSEEYYRFLTMTTMDNEGETAVH